MDIKRENETKNNYPELFIKNEFIDHIRAGSKTLEVRPEDQLTSQINNGDIVTLRSQTQSVNVRVTGIREYFSIDKIVATENPDKIWPGQTMGGLINRWNEVYGNKRFTKILVFEIETIKTPL